MNSAMDDCTGPGCEPVQELSAQVSQLRDGQRAQADQLRGVAAGHRYLAEQIASITLTLAQQDRRIAETATQLHDIGSRVIRIEGGISENTELTRDIRDLISAGRITGKIGGVVGRIIGWASAAVVAVSAAWYAITHGPKP